MRWHFRSALMWLLLFAIPLQGFAAATMISCGPNHHQLLQASVSGSHDHAMSGHHVHDAGRSSDGDLSAAGDVRHRTSPSVHHLAKLIKFKCSACAACCFGAALPTAAFTMVAIPPAMMAATLVSLPRVDFLPDGLDRPPRPFLA